MTQSKLKTTVNDLLLAVDAGGTKTAVWLVDTSAAGESRVLGRGRSTAGNPLSVGFPAATRAINDAISRAFAEAQQKLDRMPRAIMSIAGAANPQLREQFVDWARATRVAKRIAIVPDVLPVLAAAAPDCCGVALISGTGSVAFGRADSGRSALCGGWGFLLGDEGSGYAIGRAALQFALQDLELNTSRQPFAAAVLSAIGVNSVMELTKAVYEDAGPRAAIAAVAPVVINAADEGDANAQAILDAAAHDLSKLVARTIQSIELADRPFMLAVAGGMLVSCSRIRDELQAALRLSGFGCEMIVINEPLEGCVRLAAPEFSETLIKWQ